MKEFFVSYSSDDEAIATWVAEVLENDGNKVIIQAWDFKSGDNFVMEIDEALKTCRHMIIILSENYLNSYWCQTEFTSKLSMLPNNKESRIIPVKVSAVNITGLLSPISYINIVGCKEEEAKNKLLDGISDKPKRRVSTNGYSLNNYNVDLLQVDLKYYIADDYICCNKKVVFRAKVGEKRKIHNLISWFPNEEIRIEPISKGIDIEMLDIPDTATNFNVVFNYDLIKDGVYTYEFNVICTNTHKQFQNFVETEIIVPIQLLSIYVEFESPINSYYTSICAPSIFNKKSETNNSQMTGGAIYWRINNPELSYRYKIYW